VCRTPNGTEQAFLVEWFMQEFATALCREAWIRWVAGRRDENAGQPWKLFGNLLLNFESGHSRELYIEQHAVGCPARQPIEKFPPRSKRLGSKAQGGEQTLQCLPYLDIVIDDGDERRWITHPEEVTPKLGSANWTLGQ
jgi:hypothetical protein